jgi:hypothetical protein
LDLCHQDYDDEQLKAILDRYQENASKHPCFVEMPFQSTLGLNIFGKGDSPQVNEANTHYLGMRIDEVDTHYLGKRINVEVGQLLVVSCFLWHATALPCPIYGRVLDDEHWVTCFDYRLHCYLGCNDVDVDDKNLTLPGESGMTQSTTYISPQVLHFSNDHVFELYKTMFKDKQIDQRAQFVCPPLPSSHDSPQSNN